VINLDGKKLDLQQGGVWIMALPFTLGSILRKKEKKNYENSNISPCKNKYNLQNNYF
jgi:hypothetical protein